jgi:hypothetical protein
VTPGWPASRVPGGTDPARSHRTLGAPARAGLLRGP